jgi:hypothetical protein
VSRHNILQVDRIIVLPMCKDMDDERDNTEPIRNPIFGMTDYVNSLIYINTAPSSLYSNIVNPNRPTIEEEEA